MQVTLEPRFVKYFWKPKYQNIFQVPFGFSVPGLSAFRGANKEEQVTKAKDFGKTLTEDNIDQLLELYLDITTDKDLAKHLAQLFLEELKKIAALFETQNTFNFFASSLLFVYDAEGVTNNKDQGPEGLRQFVKVKMIDFAHVWPNTDQSRDENYLRGVHSLIKLFSQV